jgi:hypothetical protein
MSDIAYSSTLVLYMFPVLHRLKTDLDAVGCMNERGTQNTLTYGSWSWTPNVLRPTRPGYDCGLSQN